jgi:hypothetical protein
MDAAVVLSDFAEAINGKLYVMGGGWNVLQVPNTPVNVAVAVVVSVPWDQANQKHTMKVELLTQDGDTVTVQGQDVMIAGEFEVGRPAGLKPGTSLNMPFAWQFNGLMLDVGGYEFKVSIDDDPIAGRPFTVTYPPGAPRPS